MPNDAHKTVTFGILSQISTFIQPQYMQMLEIRTTFVTDIFLVFCVGIVPIWASVGIWEYAGCCYSKY